MPYTLKKGEILRGKRLFEKVFRCGKTIETAHLRGIIAFSSPSGEKPGKGLKVGFAVRRSRHTSSQRNRLKRQMRECYRLNKNMLLPWLRDSGLSAKLVFVFSPRTGLATERISYSAINNDLKEILSKIVLQGNR